MPFTFRVWALVLALILVRFPFATPLAAQQPLSYDVRFGAALAEIGEHSDALAYWEHQASMSFWLVITIALLGAVTAGLQGLSGYRWTKGATAVAGLVISASTGIHSTMLDGDYKTLNHRAVEGRRLVSGAKRWLDARGAAKSDADRDLILREVETRLTALARLRSGDAPAETIQNASLLPSLLTVLHAEGQQRSACTCQTLDGQESGYVYGCGTATGASLNEARESAMASAVSALSVHLTRAAQAAGGAKEPSQAVTDYARRVASEVDSCALPAKEGFSFTVLLRVPDSLADRSAQAAFATPVSPASVTPRIPHAAGQLTVPSGVGQPVEVAVRSNPSKYGDFVFTLRPRPGNTRVLDLQNIRVNEDGSVGATHWAFTIFVNGAPVATVADQSYSDGRQPPAYEAVATVPLSPGSSRISILGYRR